MRTLRLLFPLAMAVGAVGCGGDQPQFEAAGIGLQAQDEGYYYTTGNDYCTAAAHPGQLLLKWVDYPHICDSRYPDPVDNSVEHSEFDIILNVGVAPDWLGHYPGIQNDPYTLQPGDCNNGQGSSQALLIHYAAGGAVDKSVSAQSGTVQFTKFSTDGSQPLEGNMNVTFVDGGKSTVIKKSFKLYACNPTATSS